ncbi:MAG: sigma 54-interacting transcriptional regulator [Syntrophobacter sp.]
MSAKILVIDDEESIRFTFERFLSAAGHIVATAESRGEALTRINEASFDVVFADIILGDGTGIDILREIKARGLIWPVIMITGDPGVETAADSIRLGAFDYISKPINQQSLLHATHTALKYKAVNEEKEKYRTNMEAIFRSVRDAIITMDRESVMIELNEAAMTMCGYSRNDIGKSFNSLPVVCGGRLVEIVEEAIKSGELVEVNRIECRPPTGARRVISVRTYPLLSLQGMLSGVVMVLRDDTHVDNLESELTEHRQFHRIIGKSEPMRKIYSLINALARVQTTVLITGESGTGKELVAEALHRAGERSHKPLVKVNCSALPETLLESELFGHVKGAFTGAIRDNVGRFHRADGGTIFFDEIGDISPKIQLKLLRVLEEREFERVGSSAPNRVDVRLIAATNRNLREKVSHGEMREDLYYRLKVVEIRLPPLRDRREDISLLADHFRKGFNTKFKKTIEAISSDVLKAFLKYPWPGNVRELEHTMEHAFVMCSQNIITFDHLPPDFMSAPGIEQRSPEETQATDSRAILEALDKTAWNKAKAARLLGIDRVTLYRKIKRLNLATPHDPPGRGEG